MIHTSYHLIFPRHYFRKGEHLTWALPPLEGVSLPFGGPGPADLNHLITFDRGRTINGCDVSGRSFALNFTAFFNVQLLGTHLFYRHRPDGSLQQIPPNPPLSNPYSNHPLVETRVQLAETPPAFAEQEWIGNVNRVGGQPVWVQEPEELHCPDCQQPLTFLLQLDSGLPDGNDRGGNEIMFGNDGICYVFWCVRDSISGYLWQCT